MQRTVIARRVVGAGPGTSMLLALTCISASASAQFTMWTGNGSDDNWSTDANWSPMTAPLSGSIDIRGTGVTLDVSPFLAEAIIGDPNLPAGTGGVNITGAGQISIGGDLLAVNVSLGSPNVTLRANGSGQIRGQTQVNAGRVEINGAITSFDNAFFLDPGGTVAIAGDLTATGGLPFAGEGMVDCSGSISGDFNTSSDVLFRGTDCTITTGLSGIAIDGPAELAGATVRAEGPSGDAVLTGGGTVGSSRFEHTFTIPQVSFRGGTYTFSGVNTADGQAAETPPVEFELGGILAGTATLATSGSGSWRFAPSSFVSGQITSTGTLTLLSPSISGSLTLQSGETTIENGGTPFVLGGLINQATVVQVGSLTVSGAVTNESSGSWGMAGGSISVNPGGAFVNSGNLVASVAGQTQISGTYEQTGDGETGVAGGALVLRGSLSLRGDLSAAPFASGDALLRIGSIPGDTVELIDATLITTGAGEIRLEDGGIRVEGALRTDGTGDPSLGVRFEGGALHATSPASIDAADSNPLIIDCDPNQGTVLSVGTLTNTGPMVWRRGAFLSVPGGPAFVNSGVGTIRVSGGFPRSIGGTKPSPADTVQPGLPNDLSGSIVNEGSITVDGFAGTAWTHRNDGLLINPGAIALEGNVNISVDSITTSQASITNSGLLTKNGGTGSAFVDVRLNNTGAVECSSGRLALRNVVQVDENTQTLTGGTWRSIAGGRIDFLQLDGLAINDGTLDLSGPGSEIVGLDSLERNNGTLTLDNGATLTTQEFDNSGAVEIPDGLLGALTVDLDDNAAIIVIGPDGTLLSTGDVTSGSPAVTGSTIRTAGGEQQRAPRGTPAPGVSCATLVNHAVLDPGGPGATDTLAIDGSLQCQSTSTIEIDIAGPADADGLTVSGLAMLDGTVRVTIAPGYTPVLGDTITVLAADSLSGSVTVDETSPVPDLRWRGETTATELRLVAACLADLVAPFGVLDLGDINSFVSGFTGQDTIADINADGILDLGDINAFIAAFTGGCP